MNAQEVRKVTAVIDQYFDALYYGDPEAFEQIMHPTVRLHCATDDKWVCMDLPEYLQLVKERPSPASRNDDRYDQILSIELPSPTTAHVRVKDAYLPKRFIDELTLIKINDRWWIVSKVWHYDLHD